MSFKYIRRAAFAEGLLFAAGHCVRISTVLGASFSSGRYR